MAVQPPKSKNRVILLIGVACAALAAVLVVFLLQRGNTTGPTRTVLVAKTDIEAGTVVTQDALKANDLPEGTVPGDVVTDPGQVNGKIAAIRIAANTPITLSQFQGAESKAPGASTATVPASTSGGRITGITKGYVAMAIPAALSNADYAAGDLLSVGYYIQPGDHIDILIDPGSSPPGIRYSFQDVVVLRAGTATGATTSSASPNSAPATSAVPTVYVVELPRAQAEVLTAILSHRGPQSLVKYVLRPQSEYGQPGSPAYEDSGNPAVPGKQDQTMNGDTLSRIFPR